MDSSPLSDRATIMRFIEADWQSFWTQGGAWKQYPFTPAHCYVAPSAIQTSDGAFRVGARATEVARVEYYALRIEGDIDLSDAGPIPKFVPKRSLAKTPPADLDIENFKSSKGRRCVLLIEPREDVVGARLYGLIFVVEQRSLMFYVDEDLPESALVTSDPDVVRRIGSGRTRIDP